MKITISALVMLLLFTAASFAQSTYSVKGTVLDTAAKAKLKNTTIMVLSAKDSILTQFSRADADGNFAVNELDKGKYLLVISYPDYADYSEPFTLDSANKTHDFGKINMVLKARLLQDIIIKGEVTAIKIKGDTTEFNAKAYVIQPNSKVEDLLKQLPGIQVDKDGKITAQGQTVTKVLVDGEEFFGDDPTLVTKNIRGDMVDKVQLFDKKSDQATFTGIDDGVKTKTLNIKLKEGKKNGYFGKVDVGVGTSGFYQGQLLYNKFSAKQKFSLYGTGANTGKTGLSWDDAQKYGDGSNVQVMDDGGIYFTGGNNDLSYNGQGIPLARTGGMHYDNKWQSDKQSINANYKIGSLEIDGTRNTITQNNLPGGRVINSNSDQTFNNSTFRQKLDGTYQITLDTTSNLKLTIDGTLRNTKTNTGSVDVSRRGNDTLLNRNTRDLTNDAEQRLFNASAFYTKKLKKKGRTFSVLLSESVNDNKSTGYLKSEADFYNEAGVQDSVQLIDQYKTSDGKNRIFNSNITYTEPLSKSLSVIVNYGININNNSSDQKSFDKSPGGSYNTLVDSLSSNFKLDQIANQAGLTVNYTKGKGVLNFGSRASDVSFKQVDEYTGDIFKRHFINWYPQASYIYKFSQQQSLRVGYNGNTTQPSISQIQPVRNNNSPLNITLGNPDLKPQFSNNFNLSYNSYKVLSGQNIYLSGSYNFTTNQIVNNTITDAAGKTTSQAFNLIGKTPHSFYMYFNAGRKIKGIDVNIGLNGNVNASTSYNLANNVLNTTNNTSYSGGINMGKYMEKKYDFYIGFGPRYTISTSSLQSNINSNGGGFYSYGYFNFYLPAKIQISSDIDYTYTAKTQTFNEDLKRTIWNATISKAFLKESNLKLSASVNDLLNQNVGFSRTAYGSMITQNSFTNIKRYFMLSVTWDFTKMGGVPAKN